MDSVARGSQRRGWLGLQTDKWTVAVAKREGETQYNTVVITSLASLHVSGKWSEPWREVNFIYTPVILQDRGACEKMPET